MMFQVNQKVRCVKRGEWHSAVTGQALPGPKYGSICTVRAAPFHTAHGDGILVDGWEAAYWVHHFRPLTDSPKAVKETMRKHFNKFLREGVSA